MRVAMMLGGSSAIAGSLVAALGIGPGGVTLTCLLAPIITGLYLWGVA
jgi:hypothetical protein